MQASGECANNQSSVSAAPGALGPVELAKPALREALMRQLHRRRWMTLGTTSAAACVLSLAVLSGQDDPLLKGEPLPQVIARTQKEKPTFAKRQQDLLTARYDLANRAATGVTMTRGKGVQDGVRVKLPANMTWEQLAALSPDEIKKRNAWPAGFLPLPHPHHEAGGMIFPKPLIDETLKQTARDLTRFDLDFDLPDHLLPEFPAPVFLVTRPDLGDVSKGELITLDNFERLFKEGTQPETARRAATARHALPAAAVQPDRRPPQSEGASGCRLLRLPRQRPHERRNSHGRRHPAE